MHIAPTQLKKLRDNEFSENELKMLDWLRGADWQAQTGAREPIPYKAKVPEFFGGVRLYHVAAGGSSQGPLDLFIKKLQYQGVISKQDLYPVTAEGAARFLSLRKADLDNLGVSQQADDE